MELCLIKCHVIYGTVSFSLSKETFIRLCTLPNFLALPLPLSWWWPVTLNNCGLLPEKYFHVWHMFGLKCIHPAITPPNYPPLFLPSNQPSFKSMLKCPYPLWSLSPATKHRLLSSCWHSQTVVHTLYYYSYLTLYSFVNILVSSIGPWAPQGQRTHPVHLNGT